LALTFVILKMGHKIFKVNLNSSIAFGTAKFASAGIILSFWMPSKKILQKAVP